MWCQIISKCYPRMAIVLLVAVFTSKFCAALRNIDKDALHFPPKPNFSDGYNFNNTAPSFNRHNSVNNVNEQNNHEQTIKEFSDVSKAVTGFGLSLLRNLQSTGNLVLSPFSIAASLALIQQGALGTTRNQISKILNMDPNPLGFKKLYDTLKYRRSSNILNVASAIFAHNSPTDHFTVKPQFKYDALESFSTPMNFDANFDHVDMAADVINRWVSKQTNGFIQELITSDSISENTRMVLANAVFFKGKWKNPFVPSDTEEMNFNLANGQAKRTKFMHSTGKYMAYQAKKLDATFVLLPFEGEQYSLMGVLPGKDSNLNILIRQLNGRSMLEKFTKMSVRDVKVTMPKFVIQKQFNLETILPKMGLTELFSQRCNISNIGTYNGVAPVMSNAVHSAALVVDEKGATAAAATAYGATALSANDDTVYFWADKPFLAVLWDTENSVPLFMAKIEDPTVF